MPATMIDHDEALDLVADQLDFDLTPLEEGMLKEHLGWCESCQEEAAWMRLDDSLMETSIRWDDEDYGGYRSVYDDEGDDESEPTIYEGQFSRPPESDEVDEESDDVITHQPLGSAEGGTAEEEDEPDERPGPAGPASDEDDEDDEPDASETPAPSPPSEDDESALADEGEPESADEGDDAAINEAEIKDAVDEAVDQAGDDDLAAIDEDMTDLDEMFPSCAADGVEAAAEGNTEWQDRHVDGKFAEQVLRNEEIMEPTDFGKVAVYKSVKGISLSQGYGFVTPTPSSHAAAAIRNAILRSRTGTSGSEAHQTRGKLDGRSLHRVAMRDDRLFKRNIAKDPGKFLVWVMVDVSGSMSGQPIADAAAVARALADATAGTPTVRLEVWGWSNPFLRQHGHASAGVVRVWKRGQPTSDVFRLATLPMGGTPDTTVLDWSWRQILKEKQSEEHPVVILCSDGFGWGDLAEVVRKARKHEVEVRNVALGAYVPEAQQEARFGRGNYVTWQGSIQATARPLADMILRMATGR